MFTKQQILDEIKRTAKENGGKPLGLNKFAEETGIKRNDWNKFWARLGDAQKEAGFTPNQLNQAYSDEFVIEKMISLIRKLGKFPVYGELRLEKNNNPDFLEPRNFFESKDEKYKLAKIITEYCKTKNGYEDIIELCKTVLEKNSPADLKDDNIAPNIGEVYLFRHGRYYKIGKTNDTVRRGNELRIQLPEKMDLIHSIKTDDPSGIEAYWHRRFDSKRMNGEWFDLNSADIKSFKRWKRII